MSQAVLFEGRASDTEVMCHNQFAPMTMQFGMTGAKTVIEGSHEHEGAARELGGRARTEQNGALTALTALARGRRHYAGQRLMRASTPLVSAEPQVSILHGTLLWPGKQVNSCQAVRAVGAFSRNPYKDAWSRLDPWEYGFKKFGPLWKHLVDEYLVNTTPSLGSWLIRPGGQAIFVKLTPAALQACPAAMMSLQEVGINMENYLEKYHARVTYSNGVRYEVREMREITPQLSPDLEASVLHGTLLWPGGQVRSCEAARAGGASSRNPNKDAWSRLDPQEYGFQNFGALWKHLVDEYLVHATPSLGSWIIRRGGQSIFVKLTPAALQACPAAMRSLQKIGITMENYLERYHGERLGVMQSDPSEKAHESHVLRSRGGYVWCQQCGAYYSDLPLRGRWSAKLKRECHVASKYGRGNLKRIRQGLPPDKLASKLAKRLATLSRGHALAPSLA